MSNFIKFLFVSFVLPSMFLTQTASALLGDSSTETDSECISLQYNLSLGKKDEQTNGEVTKLQTFLYDNGYLTGEPTGFFGDQTKAAVKDFQDEVLNEVKVNDIDSNIVTSSSDRQELASSNFVLSSTGNVYTYTRAKIAYATCLGSTTGDTGNISCPTDAKICLDGSSVSRVAPNCEFAMCPTLATFSCTGNPPSGTAPSYVTPTVSTPWSYNTSGAACTYRCDGDHLWNATTKICDAVAIVTTPDNGATSGGNLVITTPSPLPAITTRKAVTGIKFSYTGGDGSMPIWTNCNSESFLGSNYIGINPYGYLIGTHGYNGTLTETAVCAELKVGSQIARKSFVLPIIQNPKLSLSIVTSPNLHAGIVGRKYIAGLKASNEGDAFDGNYREDNTGRSCDMISNWSVPTGVLPPGLLFRSDYGRPIIEGIPTTPGTYKFTVKHDYGNVCDTDSYTDSKEMTIVITNPASGDVNAPKLSNFVVRVPSLGTEAGNAGYLRSNSSFTVPKDLQLSFSMNTNCLNSREAQYYVFNIDGIDKVTHYNIKDINPMHWRNLCENSGRTNIYNDVIEVTPRDLGLSEGTHKIIVRGCTADNVCSPISDGVPVCNMFSYCITKNELDEPCNMTGGACSNNPLVTISAFTLKVGPSVPKAYTVKQSKYSTDFSLVENDAINSATPSFIYLLGIDRNASPSVCQNLPGSTTCATGQGKYIPIVAGHFTYGAVTEMMAPVATTDAEYSTAPLTGKYDWYVRYSNGSPIKLGGYTLVPDNRTSEYRWQCISDYGIVKGSFLSSEGRTDDTTTGSVTASTPPCNASQRGGNDGWPYFIIFKDTNNRKVSCTCNKIIQGKQPGGLYFGMDSHSGNQNSLAQTLIPKNTSVLGASTSNLSCTNLSINLHRGAESSSVKNLQSFLVSKGLLSDTPTGFYGDKTVEAVKDYQATKGLPQTGMVYDFTRAAIKTDSCK